MIWRCSSGIDISDIIGLAKNMFDRAPFPVYQTNGFSDCHLDNAENSSFTEDKSLPLQKVPKEAEQPRMYELNGK